MRGDQATKKVNIIGLDILGICYWYELDAVNEECQKLDNIWWLVRNSMVGNDEGLKKYHILLAMDVNC